MVDPYRRIADNRSYNDRVNNNNNKSNHWATERPFSQHFFLSATTR